MVDVRQEAYFMADLIIILILAACVGGACYYIHKSRKKGIKCIGCPYSNSCSGGCSDEKKSK